MSSINLSANGHILSFKVIKSLLMKVGLMMLQRQTKESSYFYQCSCNTD